MVQQFACPWHGYHFFWWSHGQNVDEVSFTWHLNLLIKNKMDLILLFCLIYGAHAADLHRSGLDIEIRLYPSLDNPTSYVHNWSSIDVKEKLTYFQHENQI